jgi:hypothetical protein
MMSYTQTISTFFKVVGPAGAAPEWHQVGIMQGLFVPDTPPAPNTIYPNVGLTTGGPQFTGRVNIGVLFTHLFHVFPDIVFAPANGLRPTDGNTIAIEAILNTGKQPVGRQWNPGGHPSPPMSPIVPDGTRESNNLPVCAVFTFDTNSSLIQNLALYFDRWKMAMGAPADPALGRPAVPGLWDGAHPPHLA